MDLTSPPFIQLALREISETRFHGCALASDETRNSIINWYQFRHQWDFHESLVTLLPIGSKASIRLCIEALTSISDPILSPTPIYSGILSIAKSSGRPVVEMPMHLTPEGQYMLDPDLIEVEIRRLDSGTSPLLILSNPSNPTCRVWTKSELFGVAQLSIKYGVSVVSDEVHSDLTHPSFRHEAYGKVAQTDEATWVVLNSVGKPFNSSGIAHWYLIADSSSTKSAILETFKKYGHYEGSFLGDYLTLKAYLANPNWLDNRIADLTDRCNFFCRLLKELESAIKVHPPESGFLVWADFAKIAPPNVDLCEWLGRELHVLGLDGRKFGETRGKYVRLNSATSEESPVKCVVE